MKRATRYEINSLVTTLIAIGIIAFILLISAKHHHRFDLTKNKKYSLSEQTVKILKKMTQKVNAVAFVAKNFPDEKKIKDLLEEYHYTNPFFTYEMADPDKKPMMAKEYDISVEGTIVLESGGKKEKVRDATEEALTNAILKVTREGKKKVYVITGHNELSIDESGRDGFARFKDSLEKEVYEVKALDIVKDQKIPQDAAVVVVAGPKKPYLDKELEILETYIRDGGRVFFMLGISSGKELSDLLKEYGFKIDDDVVVDQMSMLFSGDAFIPAILAPNGYGTHKIVDKFRLQCFFPLTRSIDEEKTKPEGAIISKLAFSTEASWGVTDLESLKKKNAKLKFRKGIDLPGPLCIAAAGSFPPKAEAPKPEKDKKPEVKEGRIVIWGSSIAASNGFFDQGGNRDFALNSMGWLTEEESLIAIRPREESNDPISLRCGQMAVIGILTVILIPLFVLVIGIWVRVRRR